jgi:hypothetical protein
MANAQWEISGEYFEACSCDFVCPCPTSGMKARPTKGRCDVGLVFQVTRGQYGSTRLDGLNFAVLASTPGPMLEGNWTVGLVLDERASTEQRDALTAIASGQAGGPMAALGPLIGRFGGVEAKPITIQTDGLRRSVSIPGMLDLAIEGVTGANQQDPIFFDNVGHPAASRLALARASRSHLHGFGIDWDDTAGGNNGHFAPFAWTAS